MRSGKELILASKPYAQEQKFKSWWCLLSTVAILSLSLSVAILSNSWFVAVPCSLFSGLVLVRLFIIYHDYLHGTIFRRSWLARPFMYIYGLLALSPPHIWKHSHDDHHKHNSKSFGHAPGSFPLMTTRDYAKASKSSRFMYYVSRHPVTIAMGYLTAFFWAMSLQHFLQNPRRHIMAGIALVLHIAVGVALLMISWPALLWGMLIPMLIAGALGTYLFYAQHNFPGMSRRSEPDWDYVYAALRSSSFMKMGRIMRWFTGNIGYHHVHHLNAKIPFYRLPEAMAGIGELQSAVETSLHPIDVFRCLRLKLWDPDAGKLLSYREARLQYEI